MKQRSHVLTLGLASSLHIKTFTVTSNTIHLAGLVDVDKLRQSIGTTWKTNKKYYTGFGNTKIRKCENCMF